MMEHARIISALRRIFEEEGERIVFWNDPEREFENVVELLVQPDIVVLRLDQLPALGVKMRVELDEPDSRFLLYTPSAEPSFEVDWLLDIRLYARTFRADRSSIILDELGLQNRALRDHIMERGKFFDNHERFIKLKAIVAAHDTAAYIDRKILSLVVKAEQPEEFSILRSVFHSWSLSDSSPDLERPPESWESLTKLDLEDAFWSMVRVRFGYEDDSPTLRRLLLCLFATDFAHYFHAEVPAWLAYHLLLPRYRAEAVVFMAQWRDSSSKALSYDIISDEIGDLLKLRDHIDLFALEDICDVPTFYAVEKAIAAMLCRRIEEDGELIDAVMVRELANSRMNGHWVAAIAGESAIPRTTLLALYEAIIAAAELYASTQGLPPIPEAVDARALYRAYTRVFYRHDSLYRKFCEAANIVQRKGWDNLKQLRDRLESVYNNRILVPLSLAWDAFVNPAGAEKLLDTWTLKGITNQYQFFDRFVRPRLDEAEQRKVFVIISDAFRYEAAIELASELNGKYRYEAALSSMLGVLPSITSLGKAALLPHTTLSHTENGELQVDGKPAATLVQRNAVLERVSGMACDARQLLKMKREDGRAFINGKRVIYVYHDIIDAQSDGGGNETGTFEYVRQAINELSALVSHILNTLNGGYIVITADHGFLFSDTSPGEPEKSRIENKPYGALTAKKRYVLGRDLPSPDNIWHGHVSVTAGTEGGLEFWVPKSVNRFHFVAGARFIHGGATLHEIVVPVVTVHHVRGKSASETRIKSAAVHVLGSSHKITTAMHRFDLIQTEAVGERIKPVTLKVALYDGDVPISNIDVVTFDTISDSIAQRTKTVRLTLLDREYDKQRPYYLVLRDAETGVEQQRVSITIDRAFRDDF